MLVKKFLENGIVEVACNECGKVVAKTDENYFMENPNASEAWLEQLEREHNSHTPNCPNYENSIHQIKCPNCGQVLAEYDDDYAYNNPNGLDRWIGQLQEEHELECPEMEFEEIVKWEGKLNLGGSMTKKYKIIYDERYKQEFVQFGKGGTDKTDPYEIENLWEIGIIQELAKMPREYWDDFILAGADACAYECKMKNPELEISYNPQLFSFGIVAKKKDVVRRKEEVEEIIEEA